MASFKIPRKIVQIIENKISKLFDAAKERLLGPSVVGGKSLYITSDKNLTLSGMFENATKDTGGTINPETLEQLNDTSEKYLESLKLKAVNILIKELENEIQQESVSSTKIEKTVSSTLESIASQVERIVDTETQAAKTLGSLEGVLQTNNSMGIEDPTVVFITSKDNNVCEVCLKLHCLPDGKTPRAWKLSQCSRGYHKKGEDHPSVLGEHPHCRCHMTTILPGWGVRADGTPYYVGKNYDLYKDQHGEL